MSAATEVSPKTRDPYAADIDHDLPDDGGQIAALRRALHLAIRRQHTPHPGTDEEAKDEWWAVLNVAEDGRTARDMAIINKGIVGDDGDDEPTLDYMVTLYRRDMGEAELRSWAAQAREVLVAEAWWKAAEATDHREKITRVNRRAKVQMEAAGWEDL
ncbi:hypothetical protein [Phenylobacterium sp.]|uniref:hypothetical protein n=1 Tax=Phenylobacterium sp. TaxID=1871053 RepID=UPI00374CD069